MRWLTGAVFHFRDKNKKQIPHARRVKKIIGSSLKRTRGEEIIRWSVENYKWSRFHWLSDQLMICVFGFTDVLLKASFCHLDGHPTIIQDMTGRFSHCLGRFLGVLSLSSSILQLIIQFSFFGSVQDWVWNIIFHVLYVDQWGKYRIRHVDG